MPYENAEIFVSFTAIQKRTDNKIPDQQSVIFCMYLFMYVIIY